MGLIKRLLKLLGLYLVVQQVIAFWLLKKADANESLQTVQSQFHGKAMEFKKQYEAYEVVHQVENGIERISYYPKNPRHENPIVMQHGMWHGAWCWKDWQVHLAENGWESHAHSLPGHGLSPTQRPIALCTLDYYLAFLNQEVNRHEKPVILMGHSMGGALIQWYLKYVSDALPAAVMVAPWGHYSMLPEIINASIMDPIGILQTLFTWDASPQVRNPYQASRKLISPYANISPKELYSKLGKESVLVLLQHNPPFWEAPRHIRTPLLWLAAERDALIAEQRQRQSAEFYGADYRIIPNIGHDIMMDQGYLDSISMIEKWLSSQVN
ncbi:hypothetical protein MASR2M15_10770 [Anaerolineales bacterium]